MMSADWSEEDNTSLPLLPAVSVFRRYKRYCVAREPLPSE